MGRKKIGVVEIDVKNEKSYSKRCSNCHKWKKYDNFFSSNHYLNADSGRHHMCKDCMAMMIDEGKTYAEKIEILKDVCSKVNVYCDTSLFENLLKKNVDDKNTVRKSLGEFFRLVSLNHKDKVYTDSPFYRKDDKRAISYDKVEQHLIDKWGDNFEPHEYRLLEKTYDELSSDKMMKYKSSKHYLVLASGFYVRALTAMQNNNSQEAEKYTKQFNEAMKNGEFTPSALAKNSTAEKLGSFSEFAKMVEETKDISELKKILPEYINEPYDMPDKVIWFIVQSIEKILNLPISSYEKIYNFIEERKKVSKDGK